MSETQTAAVVERPQVASGEPILSIKHLSKDFRLRGGKLFSKPQVARTSPSFPGSSSRRSARTSR